MRFTTAVYASFRRMVRAFEKGLQRMTGVIRGLFPCDSTAGREPIIFITRYGDVPMTVRAMKAGAVEFLTKPFKDDVLLDVMRGATERSRAARRLDSEMRTLRNCHESLTPREREVMALVVSGLLNK